ncbi:ankyrin [Mollisia scopiformis]|uniref:Ankyrin n=1 Tax=Mollisia scopiformis TaxID=149040 RepID=A0A132BEQ9_MOLSC|nr:ankyrin [Mollisia scopiformis]KUJ10167.1 ankyrin [Mollisia scopiformis]
MDPLSFTASLIAVVGTAGTVAKELRLLQTSLRDASSLLSALINEISDLRIILEACSSAVTELYRSANSPNPPTPLADAVKILDRTKTQLEELEKVVKHCFGGSLDSTNVSKMVKLRWLREKGKAERLQGKLRDSKQDLMMLLESQSVSAISGLHIAVQEIAVGSTEFHTTSSDKMDQILFELSNHMNHIRDLNLKTSQVNEKLDRLSQAQQEPDPSSPRPPEYSERTPNATDSESQTPLNSAIQVRASCYRKTCRPWCSCCCHIRREVRSPSLAKSFIGSLFIGYTGVPVVTPPCNEKQCRKRSTSRIIVSYQFPGWFWERSLFTSFMTAARSGPEMLIRVTNTIPFACEAYQHCLDGNVTGLQRLFELGRASPFDLDPSGISLLHNALRFDHFELCHFLISCGSDLYQEDHTGLSAFHYAWDAILIDPNEPSSSKKKQALLEIFPQDEGGLDERQFNRIHKSVLGIIGTALEDELAISTATIDTPDNLGRTPLFWASRRADVKATSLLLEYGAHTDPPRKGRRGTSPLLAAAEAGNVDVVEMLLAHGASVDVRNDDNSSPLHLASTQQDGLGCVSALLKAGADVNSVDSDDRTPLLAASCYGWADIAEALIDAGADMEIRCEDGWTSLTSSIFWNMYGSVELLLDKGANTLVVTDTGETLLHLAIRYGDTKMLGLLRDRDLGHLDVGAKNGAGETVWDIAKSRDEPAEWQTAFHDFLKSVEAQKTEKFTEESAISSGSMAYTSSETLLDQKMAMRTVVEVYVSSDDDSDLDHFEDALEAVA